MKGLIRRRLFPVSLMIIALAALAGALWLGGKPALQTVEAGNIPVLGADRVNAVEQALGLELGSIKETSQPPVTPGSVAFFWDGGDVEVDQTTGRVRFVAANPTPGSQIGASASRSALAQRAAAAVGTFGYDLASLEALGYRQTESALRDRGVYRSYRATWKQYTEAGVYTGGSVDIELNAVDGKVTRFIATDSVAPIDSQPQAVVSETEAVDLAKTAAKEKTALPLQVDQVSLQFVDSVQVTGGGTRLVYTVGLYGEDDVITTVLVVIDAVTGEVMKVM